MVIAAAPQHLPVAHRTVLHRARRRLGVHVADFGYVNLSRAFRWMPIARPWAHGVERMSNIPYRDTGLPAHTLDVYRPKGAQENLPIVFYVHGGAFRSLSKDTHWLMGLLFARAGFLVFNINYRLVPDHPFPKPLEDVCEAYRWVVDNAADYGGDLSRIAVAGESAGANLATALTLTCCYDRPEPWAQLVYATGVRPKVALPACGVLQTSDWERLERRRRLPWFLADQLSDCTERYLKRDTHHPPHLTDLADPLLVFERGETPDAPLPAFFAPCGTRDPLLDDSRRLEQALKNLGVDATTRIYEGEIHAFHALVWRSNARKCWREMIRFTRSKLD